MADVRTRYTCLKLLLSRWWYNLTWILPAKYKVHMIIWSCCVEHILIVNKTTSPRRNWSGIRTTDVAHRSRHRPVFSEPRTGKGSEAHMCIWSFTCTEVQHGEMGRPCCFSNRSFHGVRKGYCQNVGLTRNACSGLRKKYRKTTGRGAWINF